MASRCDATTAILGVTRAWANASSSWVRVVVPAGAVTSGKRARVAIAIVWDALLPGGSTASRSCLPSGWLVRSGAADGLGGDAELALAAGDEVDDFGGVARVGERDVDARVGDPERAHQRSHRVDGERGERREVEAAGGEPGDGLDRGAARLDVTQHLAGRFDQGLTGGGQDHAPPDAVEEGGAELGLELPNRLGDRGLRDELGFRGAGHAAVVDDGEEQAELAQIHRYSL